MRDLRRDPVDDRLNVLRLRHAAVLEGADRGTHRAALGVSHHDDQAGPELAGRELDGPDERRRDDVARDADDEEIAEALVEDELRRRPRIRAAEDGRERPLPRGEARVPASNGLAFAGDEALIAFHQAVERVFGRGGVGGVGARHGKRAFLLEGPRSG